MKKLFSSKELFSLRNNIPIALVITAVLNLNTRSEHDSLRFQCPLCHSFNTACNPNTNLARCFPCQKNFNPIDLVMTVRSLSFPDSVALLQKIQAKLTHSPHKQQKTHPTRTTVKQTPPQSTQTQQLQPSAKQELTWLGDILSQYIKLS